MRNIKFRGKTEMKIDELERLGIEHENGWVTGNLITNGNAPLIVGDLADWGDDFIAHEFWIRVNPETVSQYTGLKDKNGVEIYEGDIVNYEDGEESFTAIIAWADYGYYFEVEKPFRDSFSLDDWHDNGSLDVEVIGNIHDNPELLEVPE